MNGKYFAPWVSSKRGLLALFAGGALLTTGCSNMTTSAPAIAMSQTTGGALGGSIHGGSQPVAFAQVTLYYAGQSGAGSGAGLNGPAIVAATTTSADDGRGSFSFTKNPSNDQASSGNQYSCPSSNPLVYVVARGGNTLNTHDSSVNNTASAFFGVFGLCSDINASSFLSLSEATTVASMVAMQQYFNPATESFGADGIAIAKLAIANTTITIGNLVNTSNGAAATSKSITGAGSIAITVTPQTQKVNALANILASCINNASSGATACTTLFANATPPNPSVTTRPFATPAFPQATDTLQALYYMLANPTNGSTTNRQALYNLIPAIGSAFQPSLASMPSDWTVAIRYSSTATCGNDGGGFFNAPQEINVDRYGNIWIANGQQPTGNLAVLSLGGTALVCSTVSGGAKGGAVIDTNGVSWNISRTSNKITRYDPSTGTSLDFTTPSPALAIFADGGNGSGDTVSNIFFTTETGTALYMIPHGASAATATTPVQISSSVGPYPIRVVVDLNHYVWVSSGSNFVSRVALGSSGDSNYLNGYTTTQYPVDTDSYGLAITPTGPFVSSTHATSKVSALRSDGTTYSVGNGWSSSPNASGLNNPSWLILDGRANVWTINTVANSGTGMASLSEFTSGGASMFPDGTVAGGLQLDSSNLSVGRGMTIDQSGNIWIANEGPSGTPANFVTEIVGAAVPLYQPMSLGLSNGRFGAMP